MESNDAAKNEFCGLTEEEKQEYLIDIRDLSFDEYQLLSDDEKMKYVREMNGEERPLQDILKELEEVTESLRKKRIRQESFRIME